MLPSAVTHLLGTPRASEWKGSGPVGSKSHSHMLEREYLSAQVTSLLPTPAASRAGGTAEAYLDRLEAADGSRRTSCPNLDLIAESASTDWGQYGPAIARWESVIGRPAPSPTEPTGKGGAHRLSPRFTEWMMGLPDGWITNVPGITRNEALKACGNGVVPQQAAAALRHMLAVSEVGA